MVRWCAFCQHAPVAKESRYATRSSTFRRSKKVRIVVDATVTFLTLKPLRLPPKEQRERQGFQVFSTWTHHWKPKTAPAKPARKKKKHPILSVQCQAHIRFACDCLFAKTCRCNCPSNGANCETFFTCIQNPSCSVRSHPES